MAGSVERRGKDSWRIRLDIGVDPTSGKRRQVTRTVHVRNKREAEAELARMVTERETGIDLTPERLSVSAYLQRWLKDYASVNVVPSTLRRYEQLIRVHIEPPIGAVLLPRLQPLQIQRAYSTMLAGGSSARTVLQAHRVMHEALRHAVRWQLMPRNPADAVEPPRPERHEAHALTLEELRRVLIAANASPIRTVVRLALMTGLRQGELIGLRWQDVDLGDCTLHVRQAGERRKGEGVVFHAPKTHRSRRAVSLSPATVKLLQEHRWEQLRSRQPIGEDYADSGLVFCDDFGAPLNPDRLHRQWKKLRAAADIPELTFHELRHAHASFMLSEGINPKIVSERLGHAEVGITLNTYSHVLPGIQAQAAASLDHLFEIL